MLFTASLCALLAVSSVSGGTVNRTIDDQYGDEVSGLQVTYSPAALWTQGDNCGGCAFHPNASLAHNGTWHDGTYTPSHDDPPLTFSFTFNGTAFYIFNILSRLTWTDVNITLDGNVVGTYNLFQNVSVLEQYTYDVPIFSMDSISYGEHTVTVQTMGTNTSLLLFDYVLYTTNTTDANSTSDDDQHHKSNAGAIAGGVVGGVAPLVICIIAAWFYRRQQRRKPLAVEDYRPKPFAVQGRPPPPPMSTTDGSSLHVPSVLAIGHKAPSTPDDTFSESDKQTSVGDDDSSIVPLQQQLQFFRTQLEALRARNPILPTKSSAPSSPQENASISSGRPTVSSHALSSLAGEVAQLRAEMTQLRTQQENIASPTPPLNFGSADDMQREITILRNEIEELRIQQLGPLPEYTPPPSSNTRPLPFPTAPQP